jgi:RNA polymerase sigma-70 factor (ECF subfamily)
MDDPILLPDGSPSLLLDDSPAPELTPEQVYQDYAPRVYTVARRMVRNDLDAEDVTQDVFLQVVRKLPTFRGESALPTWLHRVTVNAALALRRRQAARAEQLVRFTLDDLPEMDLGGVDPPQTILLEREARQRIDRAVASLPAMYREVVVLADLEGRSNAEIAERLELSVAAVKSRLHRARQFLRERLAPHFDE